MRGQCRTHTSELTDLRKAVGTEACQPCWPAFLCDQVPVPLRAFPYRVWKFRSYGEKSKINNMEWRAFQRDNLQSIFKGHGLFFLTEEGATGMGGIQFCLTTGILSKLRRSERACYLLAPDICCRDMISSIKKPGHQSVLIQLHQSWPLVSWEPAQPWLYQAPAFAAPPCLPSPWESQAEQIPSTGPFGPFFSQTFLLLHWRWFWALYPVCS